MRNSFYLANKDVINRNSALKLDKISTLEIVHNDRNWADFNEYNKAHDMIFLNVMLFTYYTPGTPLNDVIEYLCQDLERTIYTRLDENNDELLKKRVFVKKGSLNYSIYVEAKGKIEVK